MLTEPRHYLPSTKPACQIYVGARIHEPARADLLLRCLRRRAFSEGQPLGELDTLKAAGADAGIALRHARRMLGRWGGRDSTAR